jgi:hypothetical protein
LGAVLGPFGSLLSLLSLCRVRCVDDSIIVNLRPPRISCPISL